MAPRRWRKDEKKESKQQDLFVGSRLSTAVCGVLVQSPPPQTELGMVATCSDPQKSGCWALPLSLFLRVFCLSVSSSLIPTIIPHAMRRELW
jgi:hypothetical protein